MILFSCHLPNLITFGLVLSADVLKWKLANDAYVNRCDFLTV